MDAATIQKITIWILPVLLAVSLHEAAHAWMADRKGDSTARLLGRLTFNPFKHIDPVGTILVPALMITFTGFAFGWAKPVPVDARKLKNPKKDMVWVALAGPASNFIMAFLWSVFLYVSLFFHDSRSLLSLFFLYMSIAGMFINILLGVLNLVPILPLDGGRILSGLLPLNLHQKYSKIEPYGLFIVIALMISGVIGLLLLPIISYMLYMLSIISGLEFEVIVVRLLELGISIGLK
ncbi:MAG: site-2 protease family protein [Gammaproteobacteria bacterium]|nr:site-2 protease family protein [Gammaproteobacteria bacterium]